MLIKIDGNEIAEYPSKFQVTVLDIDNADSTARTTDGTLNRDRVAVKRQIEMEWGVLKWNKISLILQQMSGIFFELYYPDPMDGTYATRTFYVGNRPSPFTVENNGEMLWGGLKMTITER